MTKRVLLLGATGVFGSRLAAMLAKNPNFELLLAARRIGPLEELQALLREAGATADISVQTFDRQRPIELASLRPWLVIDASGPFQGSDYSLAVAAVEAGSHYIDLADGRSFVSGFTEAVGAAALGADVLAVTGASSTPALSHAALADLTDGWIDLRKVMVVISPGGRSPRGLAVIKAILSYVGRPISVFRKGSWRQAPGWSGMRRLHMPGLGTRWASLCDTPDLDLLPQRFHARVEALFFAGLDPPAMHLGLATLGLPVRLGLLRSLQPWARILQILAGTMTPFSSDAGGMIVAAEGRDAGGERIRARWALWAEAGAGPNTPAAPAAALARRLVDGAETKRGALASAGLLTVADIVAELRGLPIHWRRDEGSPDNSVLFRRLLGGRFLTLPTSVQIIHGATKPAKYRGKASARAGSHPIAKLMRVVLGLPTTGRHQVEVHLIPAARGESWKRRFGKSTFASSLVDTRHLAVFEERLGPLRFRFELVATATGVAWLMIGWNILGVPMPSKFGPTVSARADDVCGSYRFRVTVSHPCLGLLFAYRGNLHPFDMAGAAS